MSLSATSTETRASRLLDSSLVWENHCCMPFEAIPEFMPELARYRSAGFDVVHINIGDADFPLGTMIRSLAAYRRWIEDRPGDYLLIKTPADVHRARQSGRLGVCFDIEGAQALGEDIALLSLFYDLGVKWLLIAYNCANAVGYGCHDPEDRGLTPYGQRFVDEMDRVGMIKDIAHTGTRTARDILQRTSVPVNISHSNPRALNDHPRCVSDEIMRECAATGGVLGISGLGLFLGGGDISTANYVRSVEYAVNVMGIDHVGIGLDYVFDQGGLGADFSLKRHIWPEGFGYDAGTPFVPPEQLQPIVEALLKRGYGETDLRKFLGGNFLRVAEAVWK